MKSVFKGIVIVVASLTVFMIGCSALVGGAVENVEQEGQKTAISRTEADGISIGMHRDDVIQVLGKPASTQEGEDETGTDSYLYYNVKGGELLESWQFVFGKDGKLLRKNRS